MITEILLACAAAALLSGGAYSAPPPASGAEEARIPLLGNRAIRDFEADGNRGLYIEARRDRWYYATLFAPCIELPYARAIGVDTNGFSSFDRFSTIIVDGKRCKLQSLVRSAPPPSEREKSQKG